MLFFVSLWVFDLTSVLVCGILKVAIHPGVAPATLNPVALHYHVEQGGSPALNLNMVVQQEVM